MSTNCSPLFTDLQRPPVEFRWGSFLASYLVQATAVAALVVYTITTPAMMSTPVGHIELVAPDMTSKPEPVKVAKVHRMTQLQPAQIAMTAVPKIAPPVLPVQQPQRVRRTEVPEVAQPQLAVVPKFDSKLLNALPGPKAARTIVATNTFGGSSAAPTLQKIAPSKVQTGGFGDPNGVAASAQGSNRSIIAASGSFDLPTGSGYGNGTGRASGARGMVASAGFGNGTAVQGNGGRGGSAGQGHIQTTSFATATASASEDRRIQPSRQAISAPVTIQSKPTPVYTAEARQLKVEGEVLLNVVFMADGKIRILNVLHGLGHGLDEAAQRAAQGVRFSPAMRDGHPVDANATLHIVFQLS